MLGELPRVIDDRVLVDYRTADDAGVYLWPGGPALVQTVDFFTPVVDDPYAYGQIAAANALSDIYAMGGVPRTALGIAALPKDGPGPEAIKAIFRGGLDTLTDAGVALLGGHTVTDQEIKFGYAVTGEIDPQRIWTNAGARAGDVLVLTKALGTGIIATAIKYERATPLQAEAAIRSMTRLNRDAANAIRAMPSGSVSACTDITGFGLAGHGSELAIASGVTLSIDLASLPILDGALDLAAENSPGGGRTNQEYFGAGVSFAPGVDERRRLVAFDPQTSGGLLIAVSPAELPRLLGYLAESSVPAQVIGTVSTADASGVRIRFA